MVIQLTAHEQRVIGCLIEKEITTPDQYPLSLNALTLACNQKSNRDPVMTLDETTVQATLDQLVKKYLVSDQTGYGSRVTRYRHRFCNTEYGTLVFSPAELALLCELLLRGAQTPGELRVHASRLCALRDVAEVETVLHQLERRADGPFVVRLAREPGKREARYAHRFGGDPATAALAEPQDVSAADGADIDLLTQRVRALEVEVAQIRAWMAAHEAACDEPPRGR